MAKKIKSKTSKLKKSKTISRKNKISQKIKKISRKRKEKIKINILENKELYDFLHNIVGKEGMLVVKKITEKEVSDVELAETMELKPNIIRKHLYALYEAGIVTYRRHRSKTGWYTYFWKVQPDKISEVVEAKRGKEIKKLRELLEYEKANHFYECKNKCMRIVFSEAMETEFKCGKCDEQLVFADSNERTAELQKRLEELAMQKAAETKAE